MISKRDLSWLWLQMRPHRQGCRA